MSLADDGALVFAPTADSLRWARAARAQLDPVLNDPDALAKQDLRHGKTWMVGLDALANDAAGAVDGVPLAGPWTPHIPQSLPMHPAQVSVIFPGYPKQDPGQSDANHRFRQNRDAAHMDGLLPEGRPPRRFAREFHAYILGIALNTNANAPTVYWRGSHHILRAAMVKAAQDGPLDGLDLTDIYTAARRQVFERCERVTLPCVEGGSFVLHRFALHGTAPWGEASAGSTDTPRSIAFLRPEFSSAEDWLTKP